MAIILGDTYHFANTHMRSYLNSQRKLGRLLHNVDTHFWISIMPADYSLVTPTSSLTIAVTMTGSTAYASADGLEKATGWALKPEGFCREAVCIPAIESVNANGEVDLQRFAELTEHTLVIDTDEKVIGLGQSSRARGDNLSSMRAPDFQLPDFKGKQHALSDYRGKKVLLAAYASW
jgi:hypothetical protein